MTWAILLASALLAGIAAAGVLRPFGAPRRETLERLADPLEDERLSLLRNLRDLDEERATGALAEEDYRSLRGETEERAVAVLRALEARDRTGELVAGLKELRPPASASGNGASGTAAARGRRGRPWPAVLIGVAAVAVAVPLLIGAVRNRTGNTPITGGTTQGSALSFFVQRVQQHPQDVAARLDLARQYLDGGDLRDAAAQYVAALGLDSRNAEARSTLGYILYLSGRPADGLAAVNLALTQNPDYPEALYFKGVILLSGLHRPGQAASAFGRYLQAAPFGAHRDEVQRLLREAQRPSG